MGFDIAVAEHAAEGDGGGDFTDMVALPADESVLLVGDVCGHGAHLRSVAHAIKHQLYRSTRHVRGPAAALDEAADRIVRSGYDVPFCTAVACKFRQRTRCVRATISLAGHPQPLLLRASGEVHRIGRPGTVLGSGLQADHHNETVTLRRGDILALFTDGVIEARSSEGEFYGIGRLVDRLRWQRPSAEALARTVLDDLSEFACELEDVTLVVVVVGP